MRLYLEAESKNRVGYTPDWLRVTFYENGKQMGLTLDIQGEIDYDDKSLSCRCKGDLIPWVLYDCENGDEVDLYSMTDGHIEKIFPDERVAKIVCEGSDHRIGIYPVTNGDCDDEEIFDMAENDDVSDGKGCFEMFVDDKWYEKRFKFETELNIG